MNRGMHVANKYQIHIAWYFLGRWREESRVEAEQDGGAGLGDALAVQPLDGRGIGQDDLTAR